jgi:hypothetical protein
MNEDEMKDILFRQIRPEIRKMAFQMEHNFAMHDRDRGNPFLCTDYYLIRERLQQETREMHKAMKTCRSPSDVWSEAADRCNFILMEAAAYEYNWKVEHQNGRSCTHAKM